MQCCNFPLLDSNNLNNVSKEKIHSSVIFNKQIYLFAVCVEYHEMNSFLNFNKYFLFNLHQNKLKKKHMIICISPIELCSWKSFNVGEANTYPKQTYRYVMKIFFGFKVAISTLMI